MSTTTVIEQMLVICVLILTGAFLYKRKFLSDATVAQISWLIVNVTNPAILISSAIEEDAVIPLREIGQALALSFGAYLFSALIGYGIARLLRADRGDRIVIVMMTMYANVGFIGIPLALATIGSRAMVYVSINNLVYSLLFYTTGFPLLKRAAALHGGTVADGVDAPQARGAGADDAAQSRRRSFSEILASVVNAGTVAALLTIAVYLFHPQVPSLIADPLLYAGRCTTFLSMLVLGVSVAGAPLSAYLTDARTWGFVALRGIFMPVAVTLLLSPLIDNDTLLSAVLLLLAVPAGNLPMIVSRELGLDDHTFTRGIILSTLVSPITIPVAIALVRMLLSIARIS